MNQSIAVLPSGLSFPSSSSSSSQRFLKLPHARTGAPALYLPALKQASSESIEHDVDILLEVQAINATGDRQRSWFVGDNTVVGDGKMLLLTPFDPVFLLVRILLVVGQNNASTSSSTSKQTTRRSVPYEDIFESAAELMRYPSTSTAPNGAPETPRTRSKRMRLDEEGSSADTSAAQSDAANLQLYEDMVAFGKLGCVKAAAKKICQVQVPHEDLSTYRLDDNALLEVLKGKVTKLATKEAFQASPTLARLLAKEGVGDGEGIPAEVQLEARQKASLDLLAGYLPKEVSETLKAFYTFPELAAYLDRTSSSSVLSVDYLPGMSTPSLSAASSSSSLASIPLDRASTFGMSRKNSGGFNEKAGPSNGGNKKKKPIESNGVRQLKKASTRGMSPLTSFFQKKVTPSPSPGEETPPAA